MRLQVWLGRARVERKWLAVGLIVGVYIWICVLDYLNKTQDSRSFGAKPPCQDLMKI